MAQSGSHDAAPARRSPNLHRSLCCSFAPSTRSPDWTPNLDRRPNKYPPKTSFSGSFHGSHSPGTGSKLGLGIIDPLRRIRSPGRVSPINSVDPFEPLPEVAESVPGISSVSQPERPDPVTKNLPLVPENPVKDNVVCLRKGRMDLGIILKGKDGNSLVLELDPAVLCENSAFFKGTLLDSSSKLSDAGDVSWKIEVSGLDNVDVFKEAIELMYEKDAVRWLTKAGVSRAIDILEVSSIIKSDRSIRSCLQYIEAVPWNESEEEKLKSLLARCKFDEAITEDVLSRLGPKECDNSEDVAMHLIQSVTNGTNRKARKEMQCLVTGLLSKSSVYMKVPTGLDKEKLYGICHSSLNSLIQLFEEATCYDGLADQTSMRQESKPLIERVSKQVENLTWLLEILVQEEIAEDFAKLWAGQVELIMMHAKASPMMRFELSRISAGVFVALGRGKLHCHSDQRVAVLSAWFRPMLSDFGWLQRYSKGLDMRMLEESVGQALLTLPLNQQQIFFEEWFCHFAEHGTESPNLGQAFQIWWRRLFGRSSWACK
ncbi:BTB/POZ domain-containing protein At2g13690-like [Zingiber officinale]|nr:BTB/POZ domain-containing protein At2g13690-like [Zingiber officinale]